jgi:N-acetylmuramoyl-L-alanine amidase
MKRILVLILIGLFIILTIFQVDASSSIFPLIGRTIVIDSGHGGVDLGATVGDIKESELNLEISKKIESNLIKEGAIVIQTRTDNNDLSNPNALYRKKSDFDNRISLINNSKADMYISIHLNIYQDEKYYGPQVFYYPNYDDNEIIAKTIQEELNKFTGTSRSIKITNNTYMYKRLNVKGVLIECGFLSNATERSNLINDEYQENLAKTITNSIIKYFS